GVPDLEAPEISPAKSLSPFKNRRVLLTFGLLSCNKGLETAINALPKIVVNHPDVMYVVLGNTHPGVIKSSGEEYRDHLKALAARLKVSKHLSFINKFVAEEELINYLTAAEVYVTPYLNEAQIASGTLSYVIGAGAAVVSTPYWHATELLANDRGRLFDFKNAGMLADTINELLDDENVLNELKENAYEYGLRLRWPITSAGFVKLAQDVADAYGFSDRMLKVAIADPLMLR
ncbi:MAG TPA: glycosyltransferase, partial [Mucilaginibacter sp.]